MNVLFICSANKDRSVTAEELAFQLYPQHEYASAGTNRKICFQLGTLFVEELMLSWADLILVMENKHEKELLRLFGTDHSFKIKSLDIKDHFTYNDKKLIELLKVKLKAHL